MKQSARLFLDKKIGRRSFMGQLAQVGVASAAASGITRTLEAATEDPGRVVRGMTGGELMAEFLLDWKVPYVFGLGGSEEVGFLDALVDRLELHYVQSLHEGSVMSMADGYARASGEIPVVNLHSVAGAGYAFAPMVNAYKDRIPIVITVGRQATDIRGSNAFLEAVNLHQFPKDYTRWTWDVMAASTIPDVLRRAFLLATVPPGGPTFVTFSKDLWEEPVASAEIVPKARSGLDLELAPSDELVKKACDLLAAADFPVITAGREVSRYGGVDELLRIAELIGAPLFKELHVAHCPHVVPSTHPHSAGMFTEDPSYPKDFDLYWSAGGTMFSLGALPPGPLVPKNAKVIHTGFDAAEIGRTYPVDVPMMANVQVAARAIMEELESRHLNTTAIAERRSKVVAYHHARREKLDRVIAEKWDQEPITCERLMKEISNKLEPDAIVVSELVTSEAYLAYLYRYGPHELSPPPQLDIEWRGARLGRRRGRRREDCQASSAGRRTRGGRELPIRRSSALERGALRSADRYRDLQERSVPGQSQVPRRLWQTCCGDGEVHWRLPRLSGYRQRFDREGLRCRRRACRKARRTDSGARPLSPRCSRWTSLPFGRFDRTSLWRR